MKELRKLIKESIQAQHEEINDYVDAFAFDYDLGDEEQLIDDIMSDLQVDDPEVYDYVVRLVNDTLKTNSKYEEHGTKNVEDHMSSWHGSDSAFDRR